MKMPILIPVSKNNFALVDKRDAAQLSLHSWQFSNGYARRRLSKRDRPKFGGRASISMHQQILGYSDLDIDHRNHNGLDNRRSNIRRSTTAQNLGHARKRLLAKPGRVTTSKYKGVSFRKDRQRWTAYCGTGQNRKRLGVFESEEDAARAYNAAALEMYGEFANLNDV